MAGFTTMIGAALMTMVMSGVMNQMPPVEIVVLSVDLTLNVTVPAALGVPEIRPLDDKFSPAGRLPVSSW